VGAVNEQSEHLSNAQIENYGNQTSGAGPDADREAEQVEAHLQGCSSCRSRLLDFQRTHFALLANPKQPTDHPVNPASTPDCPSEDDLRQLAAGLLPEAVGDKLTRHAATCDHCGPLLRIYTEDFSDDFSQEEQAVLSSLQSSSARWQKKTARQMIGAARATAAGANSTEAGAAMALSPAGGPSAIAGRSPLFWKWVIPATTTACALIAFGIWFTQRDTPEKVEKLLAQAYTENRNLEMRIPYAKYADFKQTRSSGNPSLLNTPVPLRRAADEIASQLNRNADDPEWLLLSARLNLLEWQYKGAFVALEKVKDEKVKSSADFLMTRSLALYEQAEFETEQRDQDYGEVVNLLGQVLQKTTDNPIALFNQAAACEKLRMYECASTDYEHLIKIEKDSGWAADAREHLRRIKEKKNLEH
jgi:hypothetical protein